MPKANTNAAFKRKSPPVAGFLKREGVEVAGIEHHRQF